MGRHGGVVASSQKGPGSFCGRGSAPDLCWISVYTVPSSRP